MNICDLKKNAQAVVMRVECEGDVYERLFSLGVFAGAKFTVLHISPLKHTYLLQVGSGRVALRKEVAKGVHVWPI